MIAPRDQYDGDEYGKDGPDVNGCSWVPDLNFRQCCNKHDRDYGTAKNIWQRWVADWRLKQCIQCQGQWLLGWLYWLGVRVFGAPFWLLPLAKKWWNRHN